MPLSKKRNRDRMRVSRLHKAISSPQTSKPVQLKPPKDNRYLYGHPGMIAVDADGSPIYEV